MSGGVFREMEISWGGRSHRFVPSNRLLRRIEAEPDIKLLGVVQGLRNGQIAVSQMAFIVATCLQSVGVEITEDQMLAEMNGADPQAVLELATVLITAFFPDAPQGKSAAPAAP